MLEAHIAMLVIAAAAAATDSKTGKIPNWLTLTPLAMAPLVFLYLFGVAGLLFSVLGILGCGVVPYFMFRTRVLGGGDVKLLAALGALGGLQLGIEAQLFAFVAAAVYALILLAAQRQMLRTFANAWHLLANRFRPADRRREISRAEMTSLRLGVPIFAGTAIAIAVQYEGVLI